MPVPLARASPRRPSARPSLRSMHAVAAWLRPSSTPRRTRGSGRRYRPRGVGASSSDTASQRLPRGAVASVARAHRQPGPCGADAAADEHDVPRPCAGTREHPARPHRSHDHHVDHERPRRPRQVPADHRRIVPAGEREQPLHQPSKSVSGSGPGMASESVARRGVAPIAARSLRLTASARWPMAALGTNRRSKWTPSTEASVVMTSSSFRFGLTTAPSSPGTHEEPVGSEGQAARDPIDQVVLAEIGNGDGRRS